MKIYTKNYHFLKSSYKEVNDIIDNYHLILLMLNLKQLFNKDKIKSEEYLS